MVRYIGSRLLHALPVLFLVSLGAIALTNLMPGSAAETILGEFAREDDIVRLEEELGLNAPIWERYVDWVGGAVQGDLGGSIRSRQPVSELILERVPITLEIGLASLVIAIAVAVPLGAYAAANEGGRLDKVVTSLVSVSLALPTYVIAIFLIYLIAVKGGLLPPNGWSPLSDGIVTNLRFVALPIISLAIAEIPVMLRVLRADVMATLKEDFVLSARSRGLSRNYVLFRHALRPSLFSLVTVSGIVFGRLLGGTVIVERIFSLPGVGSLIATSVLGKDVRVVQAIVVLIALLYIVVNTAIDVTYTYLDPRVRGK
ncbi:MAG: ABC transporter permease [Acidimicrobiales bacterium]